MVLPKGELPILIFLPLPIVEGCAAQTEVLLSFSAHSQIAGLHSFPVVFDPIPPILDTLDPFHLPKIILDP